MNLAQNRRFSSFITFLHISNLKTAQKRTKKCFTHTLHRAPKYTGFFADFRDLYIFEKSLDFCDFLIYYSVRYSGIVQSVEQRTVNPYVTGSSPVARAKISAVFCGFFIVCYISLCGQEIAKNGLNTVSYRLIQLHNHTESHRKRR